MSFSFSYQEKRKLHATCPSEEMTAICVPSGKRAKIFIDKLTKVCILLKILYELTRSAVRRQIFFSTFSWLLDIFVSSKLGTIDSFSL